MTQEEAAAFLRLKTTNPRAALRRLRHSGRLIGTLQAKRWSYQLVHLMDYLKLVTA